MSQPRTAAKVVVGVLLAASVLLGSAVPAQAADGGSRVSTTKDTGWNGT